MRIALVGAGPSAACMLESLIHVRNGKAAGKNQTLEIVAFDATSHLWAGPVYAPDCDEALSNLPITSMSLRTWDPNHGARWMRANGYPEFAEIDAFAPRAVAGRYFQASATEATTQLEAFEVVPKYVQAIIPDEKGVRIRAGGGEQDFDVAVLCLGGSLSYDPYNLQGAAGFVSNPYPLRDTLSQVQPQKGVGILGSGLTAVDIVMGLKAQGHKGPITLMSRRGLLPAVRRPALANYQLKHFTVSGLEKIAKRHKGKLSLTDVISLTLKELEYAGADQEWVQRELQSPERGIERLHRHVASRNDGDTTHQILIKTAAAAHEDAWSMLNDADKQFFRENFHSHLASLCCPMPYHRGQQLLRMADSGQLRVFDGLSAVTPAKTGGFNALTKHGKVHCDWLFSGATSAHRQSHPTAQPLIDGLVSSGAAQRCRFGGLDVERTTCRIVDVHGQPQSNLYVLGGLASGSLQMYAGMIQLAQRSLQIAKVIVGEQPRKTKAVIKKPGPSFGPSKPTLGEAPIGV